MKRLLSWAFFIIAYLICVSVLQPSTRLDYITVLLFALFARLIFSILIRASMSVSLVSFIALGLFFAVSLALELMAMLTPVVVLASYLGCYFLSLGWILFIARSDRK